MLWSITKILIFLALVMAVSFGAIQLLELDGGIVVEAGSIEFSLSPLMTAIGLIVLVVVIWLGLKLLSLLVAVLRFINGDETAFSRFFDRNRERRGFDALSDGLMALAAGDGAEAMSKAQKADRLLNKPELTNLVVAQAAEQTGDRRKAEDTYKKLLQNDKTRFVGVNGLLKQKLADGDTQTALKLAEKAFAIKPKHVETSDTLLKLQAREEDWTGVRGTLDAKLKTGQLPRDVHRRRDGVFALSEARKMREAGRLEEAHTLAIEANRLSPALVPAATMTARGYLEHDKPRLAAKVLRAAWEVGPHPDLAAAFAAIEPEETPQARIKRFNNLTRTAPKHAESKLLSAELMIAAEDYAGARKALGDLHSTDPTTRSLTFMAAIERGEGASDDVVRNWLTRALEAQRDAEWICDSCGDTHKDWEPVCLNCDAVDTISWKRPAATAQNRPQVLPMISASKPLPDDVVEAESEVVLLEKEETAP